MNFFKKLSLKRTTKISANAFAIFALVSLFQNCGQPFQAQQEFLDLGSLGADAKACDIVNGKGFINALSQCEVATCDNGFFVDKNSNSCASNQTTCAIPNGTGIKSWINNTWGACQIQKCNAGFHSENNSCVSNVRGCSGSGLYNTQTWNGSAWGACTTSQCAAGTHKENNSCVSDIQICSISQGSGQRVWNGSAWNSCEAVSCVSGYHIENNLCQNNLKSCSTAQGSGTQTWNGAWGSCQITQCPAGSQLEGGTCVSVTANRACTVNGRTGSQGFNDGAWSSCQACSADAYTSFRGACHDNPGFARTYASFLPGCWSQGLVTCTVPLQNAYISVPSKYSIRPSESVSFQITYSGSVAIHLTASQVQTSGPGSAGCTKSVSGSGNVSRTVTLSGCSGRGAVAISISAGSATSSTNAVMPAFGPSPDVIVMPSSNSVAYSLVTTGTYPGANGNQIYYEMHHPSNYQSLSNIPILVWIHGGSWSGGSAEMDRHVAKLFAEIGFLVFNINYTLAPMQPGAPYPNVPIAPVPYSAGPNDIKAFINYLKDNVHIMNGDTAKVSIAGMSAGGHLALHQATRPDNTMQFRCAINVSGPTSLIHFTETLNYPISRAILYNVFGNTPNALNANSPVYNIGSLKADKVGIFHQLRDNLVPIGQALELATAIKKSKPSVPLTINYADESNPPWVNPDMAQLTHVYSADPLALEALKHFVDSQCR